MKTQLVQINSLKPAEYNPRKATEQQKKEIKDSLDKFGLVEPIVVNSYPGREGVIIGGHQRYYYLLEKGETEVPISIVSLNESDEKELNIRLNKNVAEWDVIKLESGYTKEQLKEWGFEEMDFEDLELFVEPEKEIQEDEVPEVPDEPISKYGGVYELGRHRLMCGDSTKIEDVEKLMNGQKADMVFTDPPYKAEMQGAGLAIDKDSVREWSGYGSSSDFDLLDEGKDFHNVIFGLSDNVLYLVTYNQVYGLLSEAIKRKYKHRLLPICKTTAPFPSSGNWSIDMNWGVHIYRKPRGKMNNRSWHTIDKATDTNAKKTVAHPSPYRLDLLVEFVDIASEKGDIVLDPFGGSGSTLIACEQLDRTCYMMELDPKYCDVIRKRYDNFINKQ